MARETGMRQPTVDRVWRAFGLKPLATDTFNLSEDPLRREAARRRRDVAELDRRSGPRSTRRPAYRRSIGPNRSCRCALARSNAARTTT
jgi:hypothetical protein